MFSAAFEAAFAVSDIAVPLPLIAPPAAKPAAPASFKRVPISPAAKSLPAIASVPIFTVSCAASVRPSVAAPAVKAAAIRPMPRLLSKSATCLTPILPRTSLGIPFNTTPAPKFSSSVIMVPPAVARRTLSSSDSPSMLFKPSLTSPDIMRGVAIAGAAIDGIIAGADSATF